MRRNGEKCSRFPHQTAVLVLYRWLAVSFLPAFASATISLCANTYARRGLLPVLCDMLETHLAHCFVFLLVRLQHLDMCRKVFKKPGISRGILLSTVFAWGKHIRDHRRMLSFSVASGWLCQCYFCCREQRWEQKHQ